MAEFLRSIKNRVILLLLLVLPFATYAQSTVEKAYQRQLKEKLAPSLQLSPLKNTKGSYRIAVKEKENFKEWLRKQDILINAKEINKDTYLVTEIDRDLLLKLVACPYISFIDRSNRIPQEETELKDVNFAANNLLALQSQYPDLNGNGLAASIKEGAFNPKDIDLESRVISPETFGNAYTPHATTIATIIAGAGNSGPKGKGIASQAMLATSDFKELLPDNSNSLLSKGIGVQNHSYGVGVENYYGLESAAYDQQTFMSPELLHVFSSGNSGNKADVSGTYANLPAFANLTGQFKNSKNTLSVGALDKNNTVGMLSSRGPAYDGRIKPELVAYGIGGTSEAAAVVSGTALLIQQAYKQQHGGKLPTATLVKAALINSADDVGRPEVDFETGFGNTDALGAVRTIKESRFIESSIKSQEQLSFTIDVPEGVKKLKVTLVWHEQEAEPNAIKALINDLDLTVKHTRSNKLWEPWVLSSYPHVDSLKLPAKRGVDRLNNIEQVTIDHPLSGGYTLLINGFKIIGEAQAFSLVYEYENMVEWLYPSIGISLKAGEVNQILWQGTIPNQQIKLEYKLSGDKAWTVISPAVVLSDNYFNWKAPDTIGIAQLRLTTENISVTSEQFILTKPIKVHVGFDCTDKTMVYWPSLKGVNRYQVLYVDDYPKPLFTTTDTLAIFDQGVIKSLSDYILVAPVVEGLLAEPSEAVAYAGKGTGCYIRSFLPEHFVMSTVTLNLEVSTIYQLHSITLERRQNGVYKPVQNIIPDKSLKFKINDPDPKLGRNFYRIKVETTTGASLYSNEEEAIYASENHLMVYPNPLKAGELLKIATGSASATLKLYDMTGKLVKEAEENGVIKTLDTNGLPKGLYIVRLLTDSGYYLSSKVIII